MSKMISASELAKMGKCETLIKRGFSRGPNERYFRRDERFVMEDRSLRQREGDALHGRYEREAGRFHDGNRWEEIGEAFRVDMIVRVGLWGCLGLLLLILYQAR